jgi:hypothetical protein
MTEREIHDEAFRYPVSGTLPDRIGSAEQPPREAPALRRPKAALPDQPDAALQKPGTGPRASRSPSTGDVITTEAAAP